jgi:4-hydroxybenzoate polyprenyltransferase
MSSAQSVAGAPSTVSTRLGGWLTLARVSNSPTVASNVLAGAALAGAVEPSGSIGLRVIAMVAFYTAGMLLNDLCDFGWDLAHRPDRPLVQGHVSRSAAWAATVTLFGLGTNLSWLVGPRALLSGVILIGCIVVYDAWHKRNPLSPLVMAACRLMVYVTAFVAFAWPPTPMLIIAGGLLVAHLVGLTAIAKSEARPTLIGYWPAALLFLAPLFFVTQAPILAIAEAAWVGYSIHFVYGPAGRRIGAAVARLIAGISLLDLLVLAAVGAPPLMLGLALVAFGLTLLLQRYVEGT